MVRPLRGVIPKPKLTIIVDSCCFGPLITLLERCQKLSKEIWDSKIACTIGPLPSCGHGWPLPLRLLFLVSAFGLLPRPPATAVVALSDFAGASGPATFYRPFWRLYIFGPQGP